MVLSRYVFVGDAVVLKDPNETNKYIVRRLAALEGSEMVSNDEKDEPFVLEKDQCWVVAENQEMKSKVHHLLFPLHHTYTIAKTLPCTYPCSALVRLHYVRETESLHTLWYVLIGSI